MTIDGEWFLQTPGGRRLAQLEGGAQVEQDATQGEWAQVTLDGWIIATSIGPTPVPGFDAAVKQAPTENLRTAPAGSVLARLAFGFALDKLDQQGSWVHVRRQGWVRTSALRPAGPLVQRNPAATPVASGPTPGPRPGGIDTTRPAADRPGASPTDTGTGAGPAGGVDPARLRSARTTTLYRAPDGPSDGTLAADAPLRVLGKSGEWSRVQLEGWVKTADLQTAPAGVLLGVSAAELRAEPQRFVGQTLRWTLQVIAFRQADDLRPDLPQESTYLLARGPFPERGFVYVVVPEMKRAAVSSLAPLTTIDATVRVRTGRSRFIGNPVVDLITLEERP